MRPARSLWVSLIVGILTHLACQAQIDPYKSQLLQWLSTADGFDAIRSHGRGVQSVGLLLPYDFEVRRREAYPSAAPVLDPERARGPNAGLRASSGGSWVKGDHMPYLERQGARLFYERQGEGRPPLVFVHGFACNHDDWQRQVDAFRMHQCVVTCDLRGHGASGGEPAHCDIETYGADVSALVQTLDLPPAILIGHSLGCRVVLQAYLNAPLRVAGLVLVDGSRIGAGDPLAAEQAIRQHIHTVGYTTVMARFFAGMFLEVSDAGMKERIVRRALALPEAIGIALFSRLARWDAQYLDTALQRVAAPLLVIQSTYLDPQQVRVPLQPGATTPWFELIRRTVPAARVEIVSGAGHFTMLDAPEAVNHLIDKFIATVTRSG